MSFQSTSSETQLHNSWVMARRAELQVRKPGSGHRPRGLWPLEPSPSVNLLRSASSLGKWGGSSPRKDSLWLSRETIYPKHPEFCDTLFAAVADPWHTSHFTWSKWPCFLRLSLLNQRLRLQTIPKRNGQFWLVLQEKQEDIGLFTPGKSFWRPCTFKMEKLKKKFFLRKSFPEISGQRVKSAPLRDRNPEISQVTKCSLHSRIANS